MSLCSLLVIPGHDLDNGQIVSIVCVVVSYAKSSSVLTSANNELKQAHQQGHLQSYLCGHLVEPTMAVVATVMSPNIRSVNWFEIAVEFDEDAAAHSWVFLPLAVVEGPDAYY